MKPNDEKWCHQNCAAGRFQGKCYRMTPECENPDYKRKIDADKAKAVGKQKV